MLYTGSVTEVKEGVEIVEVIADSADLKILLESFNSATKVVEEDGKYVVTLQFGTHAADINAYLFSKGITVSHLVTKRKSLEKQFLEILEESGHA
ncbi:MAG: hypothetical protein WD555_02360 [Fulvivirga sp.]